MDFELGISRLPAKFAQHATVAAVVKTLEQTLATQRRYGSNRETDAIKWRCVEFLNKNLLANYSISFNELCR